MKIGWPTVATAFVLMCVGFTLLFVVIHWIDVWTGKGLIAAGALLAGVGAVLSGIAAVRTKRNGK